jgi:hypothetical protein
VTTTTPDPEVVKWESIATDVKAMSEANRTFIFELSDLTEGAYDTKCKEYMAGPDFTYLIKSEIDQMVFDRNKAAADALGIKKIKYVYNKGGWGNQITSAMDQVADAANPDAADLFALTMFDMNWGCFESLFRDLAAIENSYFNFDAEGWNYNIMEEMSWDRTKIFLMASDYFFETYRNMTCLPFNLDMLDASVAELGSILLPAGAELKQGEKLSDYLFQMVQDGKWTWDVVVAMCQAIYLDNDGNNAENFGDRFGMLLDHDSGMMANAILYSTNIQCLKDEVVNGKIVPTYPATGDELNKIFLAVGKMMNNKGAENAGGRDPYTAKFAEGLALFAGPSRIAELDNDVYRDMANQFSVAPMPLITAGDKDSYNTCIHNTAAVGAFNINSSKYLAMSAYLQHVTENSAEIRDEYLQTVLKYKTTDFNLGTSEMLDLIYANISSVREMIIDNVLRSRKNGTVFGPAGVGDVRWHGIIKNAGYKMCRDAATGAFLEKYETLRALKQQAMNECIQDWYNLPSGPAAN